MRESNLLSEIYRVTAREAPISPRINWQIWGLVFLGPLKTVVPSVRSLVYPAGIQTLKIAWSVRRWRSVKTKRGFLGADWGSWSIPSFLLHAENGEKTLTKQGKQGGRTTKKFYRKHLVMRWPVVRQYCSPGKQVLGCQGSYTIRNIDPFFWSNYPEPLVRIQLDSLYRSVRRGLSWTCQLPVSKGNFGL